MGIFSSGRLGLWMGLGFVLLRFIGEASFGDTHPDPTASASEIIDVYTERRDGALAGVFIQTVGLLLLVWFGAALAMMLEARRAREAALVFFAGIIVYACSLLIYLVAAATMAYGVVFDAGPDTVKGLYDLYFSSQPFMSATAALPVAAASIAVIRGPDSRPVYGGFGLIVAVLLLAGGGAFARTGAYSPQGDFGFYLFWLFPLWIVVTSVLFGRRARGHEAAPFAPAT